MTWKPTLFDYDDYRSYLSDYYEAGKVNTRYFTHRWFAMKAGKSAGYLKNIISGRARLAESSCSAVAEALRLDPIQAAYLTDLVRLERAEAAERENILTRLRVLRAEHHARWLDASRHAYLSRWYYVAVREMVALREFRPDAAWIAPRLVPPVALKEVEECLRALPELGVVEVQEDGSWTLGDADLRFERDGEHLRALRAFHAEMLAKAASSMDLADRSLRYLVTKTITVRKDQLGALHRRLDRVLAEFTDEPEADTVVQCHFSAFALATDSQEPPS